MRNTSHSEQPLSDHFIDGLTQPCIVVAPDGRLVQWNHATSEATGCGDEELSRMEVFDLVPEEDRQVVEEMIQDVLETGGTTVRIGDRGTDGRQTPYELRGTLRQVGGRRLILITSRSIGGSEPSEQLRRRFDRRVREALEQLPVYLFTHDEDLRYTWMSSTPFGKDGEDIVGKTDRELYGEKEARRLQDAKRRVLENGQPDRVKISIAAHGRRRYFDTYLNPHRGEDGQVDGIVGAAVDITAQRQAEAGHLVSEQRYRELFEAARDGIVIHTPAGDILDMNPAGLEMLGYGPDELEKLDTTTIYPDSDRFERETQIIEKEKEIDNREVTLRRRDGEEIVCLISSSARKAEAGGAKQYFTIFRDVSERKQYQDQFRLLVEEVKDYAIFMLDREGQIVTWNEGAEKIKGYTREEIVGRRLATFYPQEDREEGKPEQMLTEAVREGRVEDLGWRVRKDGSRFWARATLTALHDEQGRLRGFAKVTRDLTDHREREKAFEAEIEQRREAEAELETAYEQLKETEQMKDEFFASVSHELRTPLTLILSPLETVLKESEGELSARHRRLLETAHNNSSRLLQMVNGLLDFSRLEIGEVEVDREPTEIAELTGSIWSDFQPLLKRSGLEGQLEIDVDEPVVAIDRYLYERILFNLISNAVKFTPEGGEVVVSLHDRGDRLHLSVADTGIGIEEAQLETIFKDFRQIDASAARRFQGTGLGLPLVKEFTGLLGGTVAVDSVPGEGSTFTIDIETSRTKETPAPGKAHESRAMAAQYDRRGETGQMEQQESDLPEVVVAEDNYEMAAYLAELLTDVCQVHWVRDGKEALRVIGSIHPAAVIVDVMMPKKDGLEVCRELKNDPSTAEIPVVMLTALTDRDALLDGWEAGADEYLFKPFHPNEIVTRMRTLLTNIQRRRKAEERAKDLERELLRSSERERRRIGQDLHDGLASHISGVSMLAQSLMEDDTDGTDRDTLQEIIQLAREGARQARAMARGLNPVKLDRQGLAAALKTLVQTEETQFELDGRFEESGTLPDLSEEQATYLYWIAQEAVTNAVKHSGGDNVVVRLGTVGSEVLLEICDDGHGLPASDQEVDTGMGLQTMRYRANFIGAMLTFDENEQGGVCVRVQLPFES